MEIKEIKARISEIETERNKLYDELREYERAHSSYYILYNSEWDYYNDRMETTIIRLGYITGEKAENEAKKHDSFVLESITKEINNILYEMEVIQNTQDCIQRLEFIREIKDDSEIFEAELEEAFEQRKDKLSLLICQEGISISLDSVIFENESEVTEI